MRGIPKEKTDDICPICHRKSLLKTNWGKVDFTDVKSDDLWRYTCTTKINTSFGIKSCYFNTPTVRLLVGYRGKINWLKIKNLTNLIHPVTKEAIDDAIKKGNFV